MRGGSGGGREGLRGGCGGLIAIARSSPPKMMGGVNSTKVSEVIVSETLTLTVRKSIIK